MPLVVLCGLPCSGKSRRALQIKAHLEAQARCGAVHLLDDSLLQQPKSHVYAEPLLEKQLRGRLKSEVQRLLSQRDVVILDSLNYIKGFRYELFCVTKAASAPQCLVFCDTPAELCAQWNAADEAWPCDLLAAMIQRFESPQAHQRWDAPLLRVVPADDAPPLAELDAALFEGARPKPNLSTVTAPLAASDCLFELDRISSATVQLLMDAQRWAQPGDELRVVPGAAFHYRRPLTLSELQRARTQFLTLMKTRSNHELSTVGRLFVEYLDNTIL